jgi:lipoprotein-anchoring transpeptidase ErfK/SrfK
MRSPRRPGKVRSALLASALVVTALAVFHTGARGSASTPPADHEMRSGQRRVTVPPAASSPPVKASLTRHVSSYQPCARNDQPQLIVVSVKRQHEWACAYGSTVLSTPVTTGATSRPGDATPRGTFAVQGLNRKTTLNTSANAAYRVKYWIPFHVGVWGFHDASWQTMPFGSKHYVTHGSHGCVHMPLAAIRWLFHWVHYGTRVRIV